MHEDQQFLETVVKALVDNPDAVRINRTVDEMGVLLTLDVHADDMGKIIGRDGNTAKAIRTILRVVGMKNNARVNLKINEPLGRAPHTDREEGSQSYAPRYDTTDVDAVMNEAYVVDEYASVVKPLNVFALVNVFEVYVLGIVVEPAIYELIELLSDVESTVRAPADNERPVPVKSVM